MRAFIVAIVMAAGLGLGLIGCASESHEAENAAGSEELQEAIESV